MAKKSVVKTCGNCVYFVNDPADPHTSIGNCLRFPPTPAKGELSVFPRIKSEQLACGEYKNG